MILELKSSYRYLMGDLGNKCPSCELSFFGFFALLRLFTSSLGSRNVHLTKVLIPLIALLIDHQNHSKWHKWCHVVTGGAGVRAALEDPASSS